MTLRHLKAPDHSPGGAGNLETLADFNLVRKLLKTPRYEIPQHLRNNIIESAANIMSNPKAEDKTKLAAMKLILEADVINVRLVSLAIPKHHVHTRAKDLTTEELRQLVEDGIKSLEDSRKVKSRIICK